MCWYFEVFVMTRANLPICASDAVRWRTNNPIQLSLTREPGNVFKTRCALSGLYRMNVEWSPFMQMLEPGNRYQVSIHWLALAYYHLCNASSRIRIAIRLSKIEGWNDLRAIAHFVSLLDLDVGSEILPTGQVLSCAQKRKNLHDSQLWSACYTLIWLFFVGQLRQWAI